MHYVHKYILCFMAIIMISGHFNTTLKRKLNCKRFLEFRVKSQNGTTMCKRCREKCPPGQEITRQCTLKKDTKCKKCRKGYFSKHYSKYCKPCKVCNITIGFYERKACTVFKNTKCGIGKQYKKKLHSLSELISLNHTKVWGKPKQNKKICSPGYFLTGSGVDSTCTPCTVCRTYEIVKLPCSSTHNTVCGNCKTGFFRRQSTHQCLRCSLCYSHIFGRGSDAFIPSCDRGKNISSRFRCFPVGYQTFHLENRLTTRPLYKQYILQSSTQQPENSSFILVTLRTKEDIGNWSIEEYLTTRFQAVILALLVILVILIVVLVIVRCYFCKHQFRGRHNTRNVIKRTHNKFIVEKFLQSFDKCKIKYGSNPDFAPRQLVYIDHGRKSHSDFDVISRDFDFKWRDMDVMDA